MEIDDHQNPPISRLPEEILQQIISYLPLRQILVCRRVSRLFRRLFSSPSFLPSSTTLPLISLRPHHHHHHQHSSPPPSLVSFDPAVDSWISIPLSFLPFPTLLPIAASSSLLYLWASSAASPKSLVVCNPLTRQFRVLPPLGTAWSRHGAVLVDSPHRVLVLTELAALYYFPSPCAGGPAAKEGNTNFRWSKFSSDLPSKPRSPLLIGDAVYALCDIGSPWRSQWKLFMCSLSRAAAGGGGVGHWVRLEKLEWGDIFDILKRPRLVRSTEGNLLMVGGLKSSYALNTSCSTIVILRLDLGRMEWEEAGRMPAEMFSCFAESTKFKVFGGGDRVCFSGKRVGRLTLWEGGKGKSAEGTWRWIDGVPGWCKDIVYRGFVFEAAFTELARCGIRCLH
ncbi:hypothetical protein MLD38_028633 [Melastoma candidum]|uniref:Uncharacterized protein n=1 Tax=Melastoma candidum TaxID=119954 RepID=A0ACB9N7F3_9MYRT|nr:hypothetical protein MLD38_028633 [Melastoma candidum]